MESFSLPLDVLDLQSQLDPLLRVLNTSSVIDSLKPSTTADGLAVLLLLFTSLGYLTRGRTWDKPDPHHYVSEVVSHAVDALDF
jgi:NADPH-ferrihemoprotein reductase